MAEESDLEKTEPPSGRRLDKAREEGQVPQSRELTAFLVMAAGAGALWGLSGWFVRRGEEVMRMGLALDRRAAFDDHALGQSLMAMGSEALTTLAPFFLATLIAALLSPVLLTGGWVFSPKALTFRPERLDPLKGLGRMFSWHSVAELVKGVLKALLLGGIVWWVVANERDNLFALLGLPIETALPSFGRMILYAFVGFVAGLAVVALIDVPFQLWRYYTGLKMTKEELKQELKELEGDPQLKARIRSQQREMARRRMMAEVPKADVVVTNPTHFAVALKYDGAQMGAPQVVAKGMNLVAQKIRELAEEHQVPVLELPPLARALYRHVEIGEAVPAALYTAVAEVMAYVYQLNAFLAQGAAHGLVPPTPPAMVSVPPSLDPGVAD
ncbi:flagellar biosynthesis protein FlhB [Sulfuricystis multivorans]|uniref:flagellar biosynthesis protein FlhB n=1 Tax=Sulfuricystis multivorans TaxID=2211108 RepID=UPI000F81A726|nr:flagellar biosynthesis protein FlhB [Sulfuricystis multivorans]